ncbi:TlpA family protein disulfide reductase, partial [Salinivirga cyanobacteriivorans]
MGLKKWFDKYKKRKKSSIISDIVLVALIIVMLVPSWRREVGSVVVRLFMSSPDIEVTNKKALPPAELTLAYASESGQIYQLGNMLDKPVLLTYWATWCHHCVAELPALAKLYEKAGDDIHLVVLVNEDLDKAAAYIEQKGYDLPLYRQKSRAGEMLHSKKIPASFLIDEKGNLLLKETGATKWGSDKFIDYIQSL